MKVFITGGTGFFGKALLRYWQINRPNFEKIYLLSRSPEAFLKKYADLVKMLPIEFIKGDILNLSGTSFKEKFDVVLHAATDSTIGPSLDRLEVYRQITQGSEEVLKFSVNHNCQKFILTSSGGVYGAQPSDMEKIPEDYLGMPDPLDPNSAYGIGKRAAEHLTALYAEKHGFDYIIARCFAFVGEDLPLDKHFAIGNFIRDAIFKQRIVVQGDGSPVRSYMYQQDLAFVLDYLLRNSYLLPHKVYNVGSDRPISLKSLAYMIRDRVSAEADVVIRSKETQAHRNRYVCDTSRITNLIRPRHFLNLEESIDRTVQNLKEFRLGNHAK